MPKLNRTRPKAFAKPSCQTYTVIELAKKSIADEREVGKVSGFVDKAKMHQSGQYIRSYSRQLDGIKKKYKARTGAEWTSALCKRTP